MSEEQKIDPKAIDWQRAATMAQENIKNWKTAMDALETGTFQGRYASAVAGLFEYAQRSHGEAKKAFDHAMDQIKMPSAKFGKPVDKRNAAFVPAPEGEKVEV